MTPVPGPRVTCSCASAGSNLCNGTRASSCSHGSAFAPLPALNSTASRRFASKIFPHSDCRAARAEGSLPSLAWGTTTGIVPIMILLAMQQQYIARVAAIECRGVLRHQAALLERDIELVSATCVATMFVLSSSCAHSWMHIRSSTSTLCWNGIA